MKTIVYAILAYFPLVFIYKIIGKYYDLYSVNYFWLVTYSFLFIVFFKIWRITKAGVYPKMYKKILLGAVFYWGIMAALRTIVLIRVDLHEKFISSANSWTLGTLSIISILLILTASIWRRK